MKNFIIIILISCGILFSINVYALEQLKVSSYTWNDGTPDKPFDTPAVGIQFPGALPGEPPYNGVLNDPWVHSPQFIRVIYSSDAPIWGIRIYTDNNTDIGGVAPKVYGIGPGPDKVPGTNDDTWKAGPDGIFGTKDDIWGSGPDGKPGTDDDTLSVSYAGMINTSTKNNPNSRMKLAWQVWQDPVLEPDPIYKIPFTNKWNVGGNWNDDWAYVIDKSDRWEGKSVMGGVYYPDPEPDPDPNTQQTWDKKYEIVVAGDPFINYLADHPAIGPKDHPDPKIGNGWDENGDGVINNLDDNDINNDGINEYDLAIYIATCFAVPSEQKEGEFDGVVPLGNYSAKIYIEIINV